MFTKRDGNPMNHSEVRESRDGAAPRAKMWPALFRDVQEQPVRKARFG